MNTHSEYVFVKKIQFKINNTFLKYYINNEYTSLTPVVELQKSDTFQFKHDEQFTVIFSESRKEYYMVTKEYAYIYMLNTMLLQLSCGKCTYSSFQCDSFIELLKIIGLDTYIFRNRIYSIVLEQNHIDTDSIYNLFKNNNNTPKIMYNKYVKYNNDNPINYHVYCRDIINSKQDFSTMYLPYLIFNINTECFSHKTVVLSYDKTFLDVVKHNANNEDLLFHNLIFHRKKSKYQDYSLLDKLEMEKEDGCDDINSDPDNVYSLKFINIYDKSYNFTINIQKKHFIETFLE